MSVKSSVSISDQQDAFVRRLVDQGTYSSVSAVVQHGLELVRAETERQAAELQALRSFFETRRDGPVEDSATARHATAAMIARKRADRGL